MLALLFRTSFEPVMLVLRLAEFLLRAGLMRPVVVDLGRGRPGKITDEVIVLATDFFFFFFETADFLVDPSVEPPLTLKLRSPGAFELFLLLTLLALTILISLIDERLEPGC